MQMYQRDININIHMIEMIIVYNATIVRKKSFQDTHSYFALFYKQINTLILDTFAN